MSTLSDQLALDKQLLSDINKKISLIVNGAQEFELNDGQIDQRVKNADLKELKIMKNNLLNDIAECEGDIDSSVYISNR